MTRQKIMDNVYLTYIPSEKFKTNLLSAQLVVPLARETAGLNALLVNVLSRGTVSCPDLAALGRKLDMLYGARVESVVRKKGENQVFGFLASCVDDRYLPAGERLLEPLADLLGELFLSPATRNGRLRNDYLVGERDNLVDLIRSVINDKRAYAARRLMEEMCAGEPYGVDRLGDPREVEKISLQKLNTHYQTILPQARLELYYCGSAPEKRVVGTFTRAFAALPRQGELEPAPTLLCPAPEKVRVVEEAMDVTQGKLCLGFRTDSRDTAATMLMNRMFGGSSNAKLFLNVREKLSLCYYASSTYHRKKGLITVSSGIDCANYQRALDEICAQLDALRRGEWADWELQGARSGLMNALRSMEDSAGAMEDFTMGQMAAGSDETLPGLMDAISAVTPESIREAAEAVRPDTIYFLKGKEAAQ